jgi:hypothetical protein
MAGLLFCIDLSGGSKDIPVWHPASQFLCPCGVTIALKWLQRVTENAKSNQTQIWTTYEQIFSTLEFDAERAQINA